MNPQKRQSKKRKIDPLYLDDYTPVRTIEVTNIADDICYLRGYFEHAAGGPVSNISFVNKTQDNQEIRVAYVTFVLAEDAAKLFCDPNQPFKFKFKKAENAYQPKIDPNTMNFEEINDDCLLHIVSYLNFIDIANLAKSSTRLFETVRRLGKPTHFSYRPMKQTDLQTILEVIGIHFKSIDWPGLRGTHFGYLSQYCPNVIEFKLTLTSDLRSSHIVKNKNFFEKVEVLDFCDFDGYSAAEKEIIASSSELKSLQIMSSSSWRGVSCTFLSKLKPNWKLKILKIRNCFSGESSIVLDFVRKIKLVKFSIDGCSLFHQFLSLPAECLSELEELELNFSEFKDDKLKNLNFRHLKRLNNLVLLNKTNFQNCNQLLVAIGQLTTLKSLTIELMLIDEDTLNCLRSLKNLRSFQLHGFKNRFETQRDSQWRVQLPDDNDESKLISDMASTLSPFAKAS